MPQKLKYSEEELIRLVKQGDQNAFAYLYDNYSKALYGIIHNIVDVQEEAEDILQNVFIKIWNSFSSYNSDKGRLFTWMLNVARNSAIDHTRSKQNKIDSKNLSSDNAVYEINRQHRETVSYDHIGLSTMVDGLKEEHRILIDLAYYEGYTQEEIAKKLNMPLGTVKTKVRQAIGKLREIVKE
ncbi:MAG: RNA polymerase sigma factor [Bacteroidia bacterium]